MQYANLGKSGLKVSRIILGCMSLGEQAPEKGLFSSAWVMNQEESFKMLHQAFFELGINTFDTSNNYTAGQSERVIGKFLKKYNVPREQVVIMTKAYFHVDGVTEGQTTSPLKANGRGLSRKSLFASVEGSLERLGVSYIDVLQIHRFDPNTPIEETMEALHDLIKAGKVRYIGASSMSAWQFQKMQYVAESHHWTKFISMQNLYNLLYREEEREMVPLCKDLGVTLTPYSPLAQGALTRSAEETEFKTGREYINSKWIDPENVGRVAVRKAVEEIAKKYNASNAQVAIAWLLAKGACPIVGVTRKPEQLVDTTKALSLHLTEDDIKSLEKGYLPQEAKVYLA